MIRIKPIVITASSMILISIIGNVGQYIAGTSPFQFEDMDQSYTYATEDIDRLHIQADVGSIQISPHDDDEILVALEGSQMRMQRNHVELQHRLNDATLEVVMDREPRVQLFSIFPERHTLNVYVPDVDLELVTVSTSVANIEAQNVSSQAWRFYSDVGSIQGTNLNSQIEAETEVGAIRLDMDELVNDVTVRSSVGSITVAVKELPDMIQSHVQTTVGVVDTEAITHIEPSGDAPKLDLQTEVGSITVVND
ncbi:DUF4097 family beta strand repeat-containing protein [Geomicrobium sp. JCM 19039]|uniref:DUF4097 family beta strand repeat-containing protein n=1 Tax=Geomicrobium sp. JCM 19039 TaxID=1460636 RepID=UPI00045F16F8|nr:DUF4097 family beta strand repeat-containing protein [Geomicrobium sp. JCM 19039]GAK13293.1 hypothetical protein JCM19039_3131 [Geomicrobium sp. JCM 19039]